MDQGVTHYIGIDLGTTNCSVAVSRGELVEDKGIHQAVGEDLFERRNHLPSYLYLVGESEKNNFQNYPFISSLPGVCGLFARQSSASQPARVVRSAKSWISLANQNSTNRILPFSSHRESDQRLSAVEVQSAYLRQIRLSLTNIFDESRQTVITVPASFSEFSRRLTLESATQAGIEDALLLEEPLAAFYNWLFYNEHKTTDFGTVLVVDVGGGTTDFSLLHREKGSWKRAAVGRHLLLGGDNLDLALAVFKEKHLNRKLHPEEFNQLISHCRSVKENFLASDEEFRECTILSAGSSLFASAFKVQFKRSEVESFLLDGFFPILNKTSNYSSKPRDMGLREFGLPYEKNPSITEHLLDFLSQNEISSAIDAVLFHGGTLLSNVIKDRLQESLENFLGIHVQRLKNPEPSLGVSHGACVYALAREGHGQLIQAGLSHDLYLKVEEGKSHSYYCIAVRGQSEDQIHQAQQTFQLKGHQRVSFPLVQADPAHQGILGQTLEKLPGAQALPPLETKIDSENPYVPVKLSSQLQNNGSVELKLNSLRDSESFCLNFITSLKPVNKLRKAPFEAETFLKEVFGKNSGMDKKEMRGILKKLEQKVGEPRKKWGLDTCRFLVRAIVDRSRSRRRSEEAEAAFYNTAGFLLRPGFGHEDDKKLIEEMDYTEFCHFPRKVQNRVEYWIFLRRIAGGISDSFQNTLMRSYGNYLFGKSSVLKLPGGAPQMQEIKEMWRTFCNFEWLHEDLKSQLFEKLFQDFKRKRLKPSEWWLLGRLASRKMQYAHFDRCLPASQVEPLLEVCLDNSIALTPELVQLVRILTLEPSHRDLNYRSEILEKLEERFPQVHQELEVNEEQKVVFGESVPLGLKLMS